MAQKYDLNSAGSDEPLDMMDKKSLDRETISFCRNLVNIRTRVADEWTSMQVEAITKSSKEFMEHFLSYLGICKRPLSCPYLILYSSLRPQVYLVATLKLKYNGEMAINLHR